MLQIKSPVPSESKVRVASEFADRINDLRVRGLRFVYARGGSDFLSPGDVRQLNDVNRVGDFFGVRLDCDVKGKPYRPGFREALRAVPDVALPRAVWTPHDMVAAGANLIGVSAPG